MTAPIAVTFLVGLLGASMAVNATAETPKEMPAFYRAECGRCHVPFAPDQLPAGGLISSSGWRGVMRDLKEHYGAEVRLDDALREKIEQYLIDNAARSDRRFRSRANPPLITGTLWFHRNHGTVKSQFDDPSVRSPANCAACHPKAEQGDYAKTDVISPVKAPDSTH